MKTPLILFCALLLLSAGNVPEPRTLTGKVTASDGHPIPGVGVIIKGTSTGTVTDAQGAYSVTFSGKNPVLVFSFVGYVTQEIDPRGVGSNKVERLENYLVVVWRDFPSHSFLAIVHQDRRSCSERACNVFEVRKAVEESFGADHGDCNFRPGRN